MLVEKHMALAEGMNAAALASFGDWMKGLGGHGLSFETSARVVDAALRPARRRVKANARRLRRRRRI
jgi:hypothetical protein